MEENQGDPPGGTGGMDAFVDDVQRQMERIYGGQAVPVAGIPWNHPEPPALLVELVESGKVAPCKAVDLGCGAGNYTIHFADRGFAMTGVDLSPRAIELARLNAAKRGVTCRFVTANALGDLSALGSGFDFAYDWELLHHLFPEYRGKYVENVSRLLNPGAKYLSVCFSEDDPQFGGMGKYRKTMLGTHLYFSSEDELRKLFSPHFHVLRSENRGDHRRIRAASRDLRADGEALLFRRLGGIAQQRAERGVQLGVAESVARVEQLARHGARAAQQQFLRLLAEQQPEQRRKRR